MRTASVIIFADVLWQDGVEVPEQVMRDLCPHLAMGIAEFFQGHEEEYPDLVKGKVRVQWGAPTTPELLAEQLQAREELEHMTTASPETETELPELTEEQRAAIAGDNETTEAQAPMAERDTPPAKSWAVYRYDATAVPPAPQCHIYGYDGAGNPLTEADATELAALLSAGHSGTIMALPNEEAPAIAPSSDPLEQPHDPQG